ncbi:hypothetical protein H257_14961 [Aphanomyces astaci]|uniref:Uncharacterized protein n=1 Tax=Aphanomyces astaci TaxID=112090 RepID=W4FRS0_APHAT|nr:hypothetical protein H257_14961 [Aphanomyces astaci]ETV69353.1 hypothetical protein H257_14961 [Aphanomyces astaci]|eukprot:XP_009841210.1 hypothetical protein H257_14961 [Aphanomyces astaci]
MVNPGGKGHCPDNMFPSVSRLNTRVRRSFSLDTGMHNCDMGMTPFVDVTAIGASFVRRAYDRDKLAGTNTSDSDGGRAMGCTDDDEVVEVDDASEDKEDECDNVGRREGRDAIVGVARGTC